MAGLRFVILAMLVLLAACGGGGKYGLAGLSLPKGSQQTSEQRDQTQLSGQPGDQYSSMSTLTIRFNNPDGWDSVVAHFDRQLGALGYHETQYSAFGGQFSSKEEEQLMSSGRFYEKDGADISVSIATLGMDDASLSPAMQEMLKQGGEFSLTVIEMK